MRTVCIYHSIDLDGWKSAAIVKHWFVKTNKEYVIGDGECITDKNCLGLSDNRIDFIGYNYGQPIPDLSEYNRVIMVDISFPKEEMLKIKGELIWIDHHISAIKDNLGIDSITEGLRNVNFSACELTWKYFFPNEPMPEIVRLLGMYDSFRHKGTDEEQKVLEFQYGARQMISSYEQAYECLIASIQNKSIEGFEIKKANSIEKYIHNKGIIIYQYLCTEAKQAYKNGFELTLHEITHKIENSNETIGVNRKFICINKERFNPINFGIDYHKDGYDGAACFHMNKDGKFTFSLYNGNGLVDCSVIAKQYGGGGHKGSAGFILDKEQFNNLIK